MNKEVLKELRCVYVEDEEPLRLQVGQILSRRMKEVYLASNGLEGLEMTIAHEPELVITDLEMPIMNGIEMIEKIRAHFGQDRPIIVITGYDDEAHHTSLADAILYKPVDIGLLTSTIYTLLEKYQRSA